jgi:hypothetical protein
MSLFFILAALGKPTSADVVAFVGGSRQTGGDPATVVFTMTEAGGHSALNTPSSSQWETENNPTPVDTYHIKWEDHTGAFANPGVTPFAKSTWTQITGAGPFTWSHTETSPDISTRGMEIYISNDGGSTTLAQGDVAITADATP